MPELPEVEVLVRHLGPELRGRCIQAVEVLAPRTVRPDSPETLRSRLHQAVFGPITRRAKFLCFQLTRPTGEPLQLVGHLGMTGRMFLLPGDRPLPKHTVVAFDLGSDRFVFEDTRRFGRLTLDTSVLDGLGPEPLSEDFQLETFRKALRARSQPIKVALLDQSLVVGVGNIYANEALYHAGIHPRRRCHSIRQDEARDLHSAIRRVLSEAIERGERLSLDFRAGTGGLFYYGTSSETAGDPDAERFAVYGREGEPCLKCGSPIRRLVQVQRSTFFCQKCQR